MANYNIKLDLSKLDKVAVSDIQGRNGRVKCVVIPIEDNNIYVSDKTGSIYLDLTAYERRQESYGQTHMIKPRIGGERWRSMSEEERKNVPICGSLAPSTFNEGGGYQDNTPQPSTSQSSRNFGNYNSNDSSNLPF